MLDILVTNPQILLMSHLYKLCIANHMVIQSSITLKTSLYSQLTNVFLLCRLIQKVMICYVHVITQYPKSKVCNTWHSQHKTNRYVQWNNVTHNTYWDYWDTLCSPRISSTCWVMSRESNGSSYAFTMVYGFVYAYSLDKHSCKWLMSS